MPRTRTDAAPKRRKPSDPDTSVDDLLASSNWEKRLEQARAQRNRVLESRASEQREKPASFTGPAHPLSGKTPVDDPAASEPGQTAPGTALAVIVPAQTDAEPAPLRGWAGLGFLQIGFIATSCSLALGVGLGLGLGLDLSRDGTADAPASSTAIIDVPATQQTFALTEITELSVPLPAAPTLVEPVTSQPPEPVIAVAALAPPPFEPASPAALEAAITPALSLILDVAKPRAPVEIAPVQASWSSSIAPEARLLPQPPGIFDAAARLVPLEPAPVPPFSLAEKLFAPDRAQTAKLFVFAPAALAPGEIDSQLAALKSTGFETANLQRIEMTISTAHLRYYTPEDAVAAVALAKTLGLEARDFTGQVAGLSGRIEVWLEGRSGRPAAQPERPQDKRLFGNIIDLFQRNR